MGITLLVNTEVKILLGMVDVVLPKDIPVVLQLKITLSTLKPLALLIVSAFAASSINELPSIVTRCPPAPFTIPIHVCAVQLKT